MYIETRFWSIFWTYYKPGYQFQKLRPPNMPTAARLTSCYCLLLCTHTQLTALQQNICSFYMYYMNLCTVYNYNYYYTIPYISSSLVQSVESYSKTENHFLPWEFAETFDFRDTQPMDAKVSKLPAAVSKSKCISGLTWPDVSDAIHKHNITIIWYNIYIYMVGGFNHLEKYWSMGRIIPYIMENKKCSKPPTIYIYILYTYIYIIYISYITL